MSDQTPVPPGATWPDEAAALGEAVPTAPDDDESLRSRIGTVAAASAVALVAGQIISMGQTVALARLLSPTQVGIFAAGSVLTSFVTSVVEGGLRAGLVHRDDRLDDAAETVFRATLAIGLLMSLLALAAAPVISKVFDSHTAGLVAAAMSGGIFLFAFTNVPEALLQRQFSVRRRLIVGPSVAATFAIVSVSLAATGFGVWSMVIGTYSSSLVWVLLLWWICDWRPGRGKADLQMYREMVRFGAPLALQLFADQTTKSIQSVVTGRFLSVESLGLFRYGDRMAQIPVGAIIEVGANSLFPAYARIASEPARFRRAYLHAIGLLVIGAAAISGVLIALSEPLVVVVLGEKWRGAGTVLAAMTGIGIGTAIGTSAEAIKGAGRTHLINYVTAIQTVLGIGLVIVGAKYFGLFGVGLSISLTYLAVGTTFMLMARPIVDVTYRELARTVLPPLVCALVATVAVWFLEHDLLHSPTHGLAASLLLLVLDGLVFLGVYAGLLRVLAPGSYLLVKDLVTSAVGHLRERRAARAAGQD